MKKGTTWEEFCKTYDKFFAEGEKVFAESNACDINDGACVAGLAGSHNFCCSGCFHLAKKGCSVKALWYKLWTFSHFWERITRDQKSRLLELCRLARPFYITGRVSKEDCFRGLVDQNHMNWLKGANP